MLANEKILNTRAREQVQNFDNLMARVDSKIVAISQSRDNLLPKEGRYN